MFESEFEMKTYQLFSMLCLYLSANLIGLAASNAYAEERLCPDGKRSYFGVCPDEGNNSRPLKPDVVPPTSPKPAQVPLSSSKSVAPWGPVSMVLIPSTTDARIVIKEWKKADNRNTCAPLVFASTGKFIGSPRKANFMGGWAIAYDLPNMRSAFGLAGSSMEGQINFVDRWPFKIYFNDGSAVGYGLEGGVSYDNKNPNGVGQENLAFLIIPNQKCLYNVWSNLGRDHLELLIDQLRWLDTTK